MTVNHPLKTNWLTSHFFEQPPPKSSQNPELFFTPSFLDQVAVAVSRQKTCICTMGWPRCCKSVDPSLSNIIEVQKTSDIQMLTLHSKEEVFVKCCPADGRRLHTPLFSDGVERWGVADRKSSWSPTTCSSPMTGVRSAWAWEIHHLVTQ